MSVWWCTCVTGVTAPPPSLLEKAQRLRETHLIFFFRVAQWCQTAPVFDVTAQWMWMKNHYIFVLILINNHLILQLSTERLKFEVKGQLTEFDEQPLPFRSWRTAPPSVSLPPFLHHHPEGGTKQQRHTFNGLFIRWTCRVNPQQRGPESIWEGKLLLW